MKTWRRNTKEPPKFKLRAVAHSVRGNDPRETPILKKYERSDVSNIKTKEAPAFYGATASRVKKINVIRKIGMTEGVCSVFKTLKLGHQDRIRST